MFNGKCVQVIPVDDGIVDLRLDRQGEAVNKLDDAAVQELRAAVAAIRASPSVKGVLVTSAKDVFAVGADITEFGAMFKRSAGEITQNIRAMNQILIDFEDLPVPSVVAINGFSVGGGFELALGAAQRVMSDSAQVGLPEAKLGLIPGFGGTVRLPRVAGLETAIEWVLKAAHHGAAGALAAGVVSEVVPLAQLRQAALDRLRRCIAGEIDWQGCQLRKRMPVQGAPHELEVLFKQALARVRAESPKHQPAAAMAIELMAATAGSDRDAALAMEAAAFGRVAKTQAAESLVQTFLNEQAVKKLFKGHAKAARKVERAAVLGAGIMGGGIAYTSALRGVHTRMKDISEQQLELGMSEAAKQLSRQVKSGRLTQSKADAVREAIVPQLDDAGFDEVNIVVEAIVENLEVKRKVLGALEGRVAANTIIASNTSSLRIDDLAAGLTRPERLVGMHFFNPVPVMGLVEVVRGPRSSAEAVSAAVAYAAAMGKTPVVVKDCPGFLVNRVLAPNAMGFLKILEDGADFEEVDRAMEAFGWPMGPAYLQDVVGLDTGCHVARVIAAGYPDRISLPERDAMSALVKAGRLGQKSGAGFYKYERDPNGKPRRSSAPEAKAIIAALQPNGPRSFTQEEIVQRLMLPVILEAARALEEGIVATPAELDLAMLHGVGFPGYLGGPLKYADWLGLDRVVALADGYASLGASYRPGADLRARAERGMPYYPA
jgi:3-hydroxyacyl-CoA dehydrogenase/enoyl-CoA hydratase/3-hydroxybutyryl-CoA epimerase/enoyl-CoA isomerase